MESSTEGDSKNRSCGRPSNSSPTLRTCGALRDTPVQHCFHELDFERPCFEPERCGDGLVVQWPVIPSESVAPRNTTVFAEDQLWLGLDPQSITIIKTESGLKQHTTTQIIYCGFEVEKKSRNLKIYTNGFDARRGLRKTNYARATSAAAAAAAGACVLYALRQSCEGY